MRLILTHLVFFANMKTSPAMRDTTTSPLSTDVLIIGSGAAGLCAALTLSNRMRVTIITKDTLRHSSSSYAQGGIAAVLNNQHKESIERHIQDTIKAGAFMGDPSAIRFIVENGHHAIKWLIEQGVLFNKQPNSTSFHLTQEGGHTQRRIFHVADKTGAAVIATLAEQVKQNQSIQLLESLTAIDLLCESGHCVGATFFDNNLRKNISVHASYTILATGGASGIYLNTTSTLQATGDGIAMASRAGAAIRDMEFHQFHPTSLYHSKSPPFLITEAMRGEGAHLTLPNGDRFLHKYHEQAELAPRDIVARAMTLEMKRHQIQYLLLNISHRPKTLIQKLFPSIYTHCLGIGLDITTSPIPVAPAAHYTCGGVVTDQHAKTSIEQLYAVGETACTGLHGANRMASNSLLECLVMAMSASKHILKDSSTAPPTQLKSKLIHSTEPLEDNYSQSFEETRTLILQTRQCIWENAGIIRSYNSLHKATEYIDKIQRKISKIRVNDADALSLKNLVECASLTLKAATQRQENVGAHFNIDLSAH